MERLKRFLSEITGADQEAIKLAQEELDRKMKPQGSLGTLEEIAVKLAGIGGYPVKRVPNRCHIVAAADNGIVAQGVASCPLEYTRLVSEAMLNRIAAIGLLTKKLGIDFNLIDIGIKDTVPRDYPNLYRKPVMLGTKDFYVEPAMTQEECLKAIFVGIEMMESKKDFDIFSNGEMGIGNTSTSSAVLYSLTRSSIEEVVGRGGGLSDEKLLKKRKVIFESCVKYNTFQLDVLEVLASVGGLDIAFLTGLYIGAAKCRKLILVDGFISSVAALAACRLNPLIKDYLLITHMSEEPGMKIILKELGAEPFLNMNMRLGEGTGAVLAYPIIKSALEVYKNMKTPEEVYKMFFN